MFFNKICKRLGVSVLAASLMFGLPITQVNASAFTLNSNENAEENDSGSCPEENPAGGEEDSDDSSNPEQSPSEEEGSSDEESKQDASDKDKDSSEDSSDKEKDSKEEDSDKDDTSKKDKDKDSTEEDSDEDKDSKEEDSDKEETSEDGQEESAEESEEDAEEEEDEEEMTNEDLIAQANINFNPDEVLDDFRFYQVDKSYAFAKEDMNIYESKEDGARVVGTLPKGGVAYVLEIGSDGWFYVESGDVRGFAAVSDLYRGDEADNLLVSYAALLGIDDLDVSDEETIQNLDIDAAASVATATVAPAENEALDYVHKSAYNKVIEKNYAVVNISSKIFTDKTATSEAAGKLDAGDLCYIIDDSDDTWAYVESDDVRGFVRYTRLTTGSEAEQAVEEKGEDNFSLASQYLDAEDNPATYYTTTSVKDGVPGIDTRKALLNYALQFVGNPYVWGGNSLLDGVDCSGFAQQIYMQFGYMLPRVAENQAYAGEQIPVSEAAPGDLIFYAEDGYIYHVVIYAGEGKTVEAKGQAYGITTAHVNYNNAVWAVRLIQ